MTLQSDPSDDGLVVVGQVGPARGVRGDVFVAPRTDSPEERFAPGQVLTCALPGTASLTVERSSFAGGKLVVHFAGFEDRESVETLRGAELSIDSASRPALDDPDEFYDSDLVGLRADHVDGSVIGTVIDVTHAGGATYLVLEVEGRERLVPFVSVVVPAVDVPAGTVTIDPPDGLFDL